MCWDGIAAPQKKRVKKYLKLDGINRNLCARVEPGHHLLQIGTNKSHPEVKTKFDKEAR